MQSSSNVFIVIIFTFSIVSLFSDRKRYEARGSFHLLASSNVKSFRLQIDQSPQIFTIYIFYMYLKLSYSSPCHFKSLKFNNLLYRKTSWVCVLNFKNSVTVSTCVRAFAFHLMNQITISTISKKLGHNCFYTPDLEALCSWILIERPWGFSGLLSAEMGGKLKRLKLEELKIKLGGCAD